MHATHGCELTGAIEHKGSIAVGQDAGLLAGLGKLGVHITDDPLDVIAAAEAVIDFTIPGASVECADLAANARIVHVIGTTGFTAQQKHEIEAAAKDIAIVFAANMSPGMNGTLEYF